jgi:TMEM175 potassium channel family protein
MSKTRFESFSDGVFAFAITLLVLGFALPAAKLATNRELTQSLLSMWPNALAYALSFMVIGIMWQNHQALMRVVERVDRTTVVWNFFLLAGTAFIPFATSAIGQYPQMRASAFLYGMTLTETAIAYSLILSHLIRTRAFNDGICEERIASTRLAYRIGLAVYVTATLLALLWPVASFAAYVGIAVYYLIPRGVDDDITPTEEA